MAHLLKASNGHLLRNSSGHLTTKCCCKKCFTLYVIQWNCSHSTWGAWSSSGNFCLDPATTSTARTFSSFVGGGACNYQQYVRKSPDVNCTANGDCTSAATAPAVPTDTPSDCGCTECGYTHAVPFNVTVTIAGTTGCTVCFTSADNTGSAKLAGNVDGTWTLDRTPFLCAWQKTVSSPLLDRDCFDLDCSYTNGPRSDVNTMVVKLGQVGVNTWRITVTAGSGGTLYYDSGNFTWNDVSAFSGTGSGAQANTSPGCTMATGCIPSWGASGGTGAAQF